MKSEAVVLSWLAPDQMDRNLTGLVSAMGLDVRTVTVTTEMVRAVPPWENLSVDKGCVLTTSRSLTGILNSGVRLKRFREVFLDNLDYLFVVGFSGDKDEQFVLDALTGGTLGQPVSLPGGEWKYAVNPHSRDLCPYLSGLTFGPVDRTTDSGFVARNQDDRLVHHIRINDHPFFVELKTRRTRLFLLACSTVADIDASLASKDSIRHYFSRFVPEIFLLRHAFGPYCWHSPQSFGCFIVDDPLLRERYGFLEYGPLLEAMDRYRFSTSIAFIPWNYRRTKPSIAHLFRERPDRFSMSVHGCNHTEAEYGSENSEDLLKRTTIACQRMMLHKKATGVDFDPVMVFPMGHFSIESLRVLKSCGFLGAVNTTAGAVGRSLEHPLGSLFELPATQCEGFPLFMRRYPEELADFALDLFLGKPALIVEHHDYFREGVDKLVDFVGRLNEVAHDMQWCSLGAILERVHLEKTDGNGMIEVKFYTRAFRLRNQGKTSLRYMLRKEEGGSIPVSRVLRDNVPIPFSFDDSDLTIELDLAGGAETEVSVEYEGPCAGAVGSFVVKERLSAGLRRYLSDFRDNYLSKNDSLMKVSRRLKTALYRH